jgi:hypothetical protein
VGKTQSVVVSGEENSSTCSKPKWSTMNCKCSCRKSSSARPRARPPSPSRCPR